MNRRKFLLAAGTATAATLAHALPRAARATADEHASVTYAKLAILQSQYRRIVRRGLGEPYRATLLCERQGREYLGGGLDPIATIARHDRRIADQAGGVVYISERTIGSPDIYVDIEYPLKRHFERVLFVSKANKAAFEEAYGGGTLLLLNGLNCLWGAASGPLSNYRRGSHWAQPGLGAITVVRVTHRRTGAEVTALGLNLFSRGADWNAKGLDAWNALRRGYTDLLIGLHAWDEPERPGMPLLTVHECV